MNATQLLEHFDRLLEAPDAVPRLRRFILDLAVRGQLVAQDARDEPAPTLLKQIESEIARLVKIGEMRKPKALPPIEIEEEPFDVPTGWRWVRIRQVTSDRGQTTPAGEFTYIDVGSINKEAGVLGEHKVLSASDAPSRARKVVGKGDVLYSCVRPTLLNIAVIEGEITPTPIASTAFAVLNSFGLVLPRYLWIALRSPYLEAIVESGMRGQAYPAINDAEFALLPLALPPLPEQHRIVAKVDELMALCDQLEAAQQERERRRDRLAAASLQRLNQPAADTPPEAQREHARFHLHHLPRLTTRPEHIKAMRQTIRKLAISGQITRQEKNDAPASELLIKNQHWRAQAIKHKQIRDPRKELLAIGGDDAPYPLPKQWSWARLGEVIYIQSGDGLIAANMKDGSIPVFGGNGVNGHHDAFNIDKPTLVIGRVGYYCGSIHVTPDRAWVTDNAFVTHFCRDLFSLRFLALLLATTNLKENEGATAQPVISGSKIYPLIVGIPPVTEQHRIVAKVDELMALCDQLETQLNTTQTDSRRLLESVLETVLAPA